MGQGGARTGLDGGVDVRSRLEVDPVEAGVDGKTREQSVLGAVSVARRQVDGTSLVVQ